MSQFPKGFLWGAATAAYQVEGGMTLTVKAYPFGTCFLISRVLRTKELTAMLLPTTTIALKRMWRSWRNWG